MKRALHKIGELLDIRDVVFFSGIILLGYGLYQFSPALMCVILGALFIFLCFWR